MGAAPPTKRTGHSDEEENDKMTDDDTQPASMSQIRREVIKVLAAESQLNHIKV